MPDRAPAVAAAWGNPACRGRAAAVLGTLALALVVAAAISRDPPDFSSMPIVALVRDGEQNPIWAIRLAGAAHQISVESLRSASPPAGCTYRLWLSVADRIALHQLGLLPLSGHKSIAVSPQQARLLGAAGELVVTMEPIGGSPGRQPSGPVLFRGSLPGAG
jgi:anti-sigma-K factor RskA